MNLPKIYALIAPDGRLLDARTEPPVSWEAMGGKVHEYVPVESDQSIVPSLDRALAGLTEDDCVNFILAYLRNLDRELFPRSLLRMVEKSGVRETVKSLVRGALP